MLARHENRRARERSAQGRPAFFVAIRGRSRSIGFAQLLVDFVLHRERVEGRSTPSHDGRLAWLLGVSRRTAQRWRLIAYVDGWIQEGPHGLEPTAKARELAPAPFPVAANVLRRRDLGTSAKILWGIVRREQLRLERVSKSFENESGRFEASKSPWLASDGERARRAGLSRRTLRAAADRLQARGWARFAVELRRTGRGLPLRLRVGVALPRPRACRRVASVPKTTCPHGPSEKASFPVAVPDLRALVVRGVVALDARRAAPAPAAPAGRARDLQAELRPWERHGGADVRALWEILRVSEVHQGPAWRRRRTALAVALSRKGIGAAQLAAFVLRIAERARNLGAYLARSLARLAFG